ncbi:MAG: DUF3429 domain-containing protein [Pseudomonadales bacterium]|nr:DUF3429 domain-containing protein [Pseudomonadales bacterium]
MNAQLEKNIRRTRRLSFAGLLPFYGLLVPAWHDPTRHWALAGLAAYAAVIIAFLGAIHWGRALNRFDRGNQFPTLLFGIMPAVLGWFALMLPLELALPMLAAGLVFVWGTEQMVFSDQLPTWYRHLRHQLTAAAVLAVLIGWAAAMMPLF